MSLKTKVYAAEVGGVPTDFIFTAYMDRILVIVTQLGTAGTVISASRDGGLEGNAAAPTYSTTVLLGRRDEPLLTLCARRIVEEAAIAGCNIPLLICLGLGQEQHTPEVMRQVAALVAANNVWS